MSLTRKQWLDMWIYIKAIEIEASALKGNWDRADKILKSVKKIKDQIQSVIGQLE